MPRPSSPGFVCSECGWATVKWAGRCGECQAWGTVVERGVPMVAVTPASVPDARVARPISALDVAPVTHWPSGILELDRVLGGGFVPGAAILMSGEPGV